MTYEPFLGTQDGYAVGYATPFESPKMAKSDRRYLEQHGGTWRVVIPVPRALQRQVGKTKLKCSLGVDSLQVANRLKWAVVNELKRQLTDGAISSDGNPFLREALLMREALQREVGGPDEFSTQDAIDLRADQLRGEPVREDDGEPIYDAQREAEAGYYHAVASGRATPLRELLAQFHVEAVNRKERTKGDDSRALGYLITWCTEEHLAPTVEAMTRRVAGRFVAALPTVAKSARKAGGARLSPRTVNKYMSSLAAYWKWLVVRDRAAENVWRGLALAKEVREREDREREFTEDEMRRLLSGSPRMPELVPMMNIAALTGARLDAIASLRAKDCAHGNFQFKRQKRETEDRLVPIHSALVDLVANLVAGKSLDDPLFPAFPVPPRGSQRERSMPASKAFSRYRQSVGVDDRRPGRKRGLVNFHSFRRWFITKAEQAGIAEGVIAKVVGHKRQGMTLGLYSGGPGETQLRACAEAVKLPE